MDRKSIRLAIRMDHVKSGICSQPIPGARITAIVVRKLIPVRVDEATSMIWPATHIVVPM